MIKENILMGMKEIVENLYPMNRTLLGEGYDNALQYLHHLIPLEILEFKSGTKLETWTVPKEWVVRDAWIKFRGEKICDYQKQPLSLLVGSVPTHKTVALKELLGHIHYSDDLPDATSYEFKYYDHDWGFCLPKNEVRSAIDKSAVENNLLPDGEIDADALLLETSKMEEGDYEVFIDTEYREGTMKLGVHTIKGSEREILLFAHLDHPFQANDNLSGVACLVDLAKKLECDHTVKIIFCPETIGSIAYALTQDISKVDFTLAVDICGNVNSMLLQKSFDGEARINRVAHLALQALGETYRKGHFRNTIGSDEYAFNDPSINIPGIMLSRFPFKEYHTSNDTPDKINYEMIEKTGKVIAKIIEIWEKDFIPKRKFKGPLSRSKYKIQTENKFFSLSWDYFIYKMDGKKTLAELCCEYGLNFDHTLEVVNRMINEQDIEWSDFSPRKIKKTRKQK